jgi:hypothetical protein
MSNVRELIESALEPAYNDDFDNELEVLDDFDMDFDDDELNEGLLSTSKKGKLVG